MCSCLCLIISFPSLQLFDFPYLCFTLPTRRTVQSKCFLLLNRNIFTPLITDRQNLWMHFVLEVAFLYRRACSTQPRSYSCRRTPLHQENDAAQSKTQTSRDCEQMPNEEFYWRGNSELLKLREKATRVISFQSSGQTDILFDFHILTGNTRT